MRDLEADIRAALRRGHSPFTVDQVFAALWAGRLRLYIGEHLSASAWVRDGVPEIVHIAGRWDRGEVLCCLRAWRALEAEAGARGQWSGRAGWARFLAREIRRDECRGQQI